MWCSCSTRLSILPCHRWHVLEFRLLNLPRSWTRWDEWYLSKSGASRVWWWAIEPQAAFLHVSLASPLLDFASESCDVEEKDLTVLYSLNLYNRMNNAYWFGLVVYQWTFLKHFQVLKLIILTTIFILISFRCALSLFPSTVRTLDELAENSQLYLFLEIYQYNRPLELFYLKPQWSAIFYWQDWYREIFVEDINWLELLWANKNLK